jgi:hypothetical protein
LNPGRATQYEKHLVAARLLAIFGYKTIFDTHVTFDRAQFYTRLESMRSEIVKILHLYGMYFGIDASKINSTTPSSTIITYINKILGIYGAKFKPRGGIYYIARDNKFDELLAL